MGKDNKRKNIIIIDDKTLNLKKDEAVNENRSNKDNIFKQQNQPPIISIQNIDTEKFHQLDIYDFVINLKVKRFSKEKEQEKLAEKGIDKNVAEIITLANDLRVKRFSKEKIRIKLKERGINDEISNTVINNIENKILHGVSNRQTLRNVEIESRDPKNKLNINSNNKGKSEIYRSIIYVAIVIIVKILQFIFDMEFFNIFRIYEQLSSYWFDLIY